MINLDALLAESSTPRQRFEFTLNGKQWSLPHIADLTLDQSNAVDTGGVKAVILEVAGEHADELAAFVGRLTNEQAGRALIGPWLAHARMAPGESPASSS